MRFTPSAKYLMYARSAAKTLRWHVYLRVTSSLSEPLTSGTAWIEASDHLVEVPDFSSNVEHDLGQFATDSIDVVGKGIAWWETTFFSLATETDYVECKIQFELGGHPDWCTDTVVVFSGFVDHVRRQRQELDDSVHFSVFTVQDMGDRIPAEVLAVQPINTDIDGTGTDGLALLEIPRLYVKSAALAGHELVVGSHTITYQYTDGAPYARLDDGEYVALVNFDNTLYNADSSQSVQVYTVDIEQLPKLPTEISVYVVVLVQGNTLPYAWPHYVSAKTLLTRIHTLLGISSITWGSLEIPTHDGSRKVSFLDMPPEDDSFAYRWAVATDGTDLWVGVGNKLYKRTMSTGAYTLKATLTNGYIISRIFYDATGYVWAYAQQSLTNITGYLLRHTIATGINSSEVTLANSSRYAIELFPSRGIVYVNTATKAVREVPGSTMTDALVFANTDLEYDGTDGPTGGFCFMRSGKLWIQTVLGGTYYYHSIYYAAGNWENDGTTIALAIYYSPAAYHVSEDRIYFVDVTTGKVKSHTCSSGTTTDVLTLTPADTLIEGFCCGNSVVYFTTPGSGYLYSISANSATLLNSAVRTATKSHALAYIDRLYGLDEAGRIFQYHTSLALYVKDARFDGDTVTGAMRRILTAFMLAGNIRSTKTAFVLPRTNSSGALITTGSTLSVTEDEACDVSESREYVSAAQLVEVANADTRFTYNGSTWNSLALSTARTVSLSSDLIPSEIVKDLCYQAWQFFKNAHHLVTLTLASQPYFQYEPFDAASMAIDAQHNPITATGAIYGTTAQKDGGTQFKVLV